MNISYSLKEILFNNKSIITVGMFDGVHRAHEAIIDKVVQRANFTGGRSVIVTFDPHPKEIVAQGKMTIELLSTLNEKLYVFNKKGIDLTFIIPFTKEFSELSFATFYSNYIIKGIGVKEVIEGYNHQFGHNREGGMNQLIELGKQHHFTVETMPLMKEQDAVISSSTIRELLHKGDIPFANKVLGYEYHFTGTVIRGHGRGKQMGYPTANIKLDNQKKLVPKTGVYAVKILVRNKWYNGMMSIGFNPTFNDVYERSVEVNIFDFDMDIYDDIVTVRCLERTREEMKFDSIDQLIKEMGKDKIKTKSILENYTHII